MTGSTKVNLLSSDVGSLSRWVPTSEPGTLYVLGDNGGMSVAPDARFTLFFGRNADEVHVCVGADDPFVSRRHGLITRQGSRWVLSNTGGLPIRMPGPSMVLEGTDAELEPGYTPLHIVAPGGEHLLQVRISTHARQWPNNRQARTTKRQAVCDLNDVEKLVLVCLGQRYLRHEPYAQPLTWKQVAFELGALRPNEKWSKKRVERIVASVRERLSRKVRGLRAEEIPPPVGNALNINLLTHLIVTTTIVRTDLELLEPGWHQF